jgi:hypothetical protein
MNTLRIAGVRDHEQGRLISDPIKYKSLSYRSNHWQSQKRVHDKKRGRVIFLVTLI